MTQSTPRFHEKRETILDGAARLFNQHGIRGGTLAEVAKSVGLMTNSLTYYYRRKEDLASACLMRSIEVLGRLAEAADAEPDRASRVAAFVQSHVALLADIAEGRHAELSVFSDIRALAPPHDEPVFAAYNAMFRTIRRLLRDDDGGEPPRAAWNAEAHLLLSLVSWTRTWIGRFEPADHPAVGRRIVDILLNGLAAPGATWTESVDARLPLDPANGGAVGDAYLRAATRLINEHGYRGASVDRIAAELKLTKGSFYHHHPTKEDLVSACFERTFQAIRAAQAAAEAQPGSGWQRLMLAVQALVRFQLSVDGPLLRVSAWSALPDALRRDKLRTMARLGERFSGVVVDGMADGSIRIVDPSIAAQMVSGMINAAAELPWWVRGIDADHAPSLYARPLMLGLQRAAGPTPARGRASLADPGADSVATAR